MLTNNRSYLILTLVALFPFASATAALPPRPARFCYVEFTFGNSVIGRFVHKNEAPLKAKITQSAIGSLSRRFGNWEFRPGDQQSFPKLEIWIQDEDTAAFDLCVQLLSTPGAIADGPWRGQLFRPGDYEAQGALPADKDLPDEIAKRLETTILARCGVAIKKALGDHVPLYSEITPPNVPLLPQLPHGKEPHAILPLEAKRHNDLAASEFRIECEWPGGIVDLHSAGTGKFAPYSATGLFLGIEVVHRGWDRDSITSHRKDLPQLTARGIYLEREVFIGGFVGDPNGGGLTPKIAP